jgi:hypothetical protein
MNKLTALVEAANRLKHNMIGPVSMVVSADTILELCALLEKAEEALKKNFEFLETPVEDRKVMPWTDTYDALAAIKQWKEQT